MSLVPPDPPLSDGVVILRCMDESDLPTIERAASDAEIRKWFDLHARSPADYLAAKREAWAEGTGASFAICDATRPDTCLGQVFIERDDDGRGSVGYWLFLEYGRGKGRATRAVRLMASWALAEMRLGRLQLHTDPENVASQRRGQALRGRAFSAPTTVAGTAPAPMPCLTAASAWDLCPPVSPIPPREMGRRLASVRECPLNSPLALALRAAERVQPAPVLLRRPPPLRFAPRGRASRRSRARCSRAATDLGVSSYRPEAIRREPRLSARPATTTVHRGRPRRISSVFATRTSLAGFTRVPFSCTRPPSTASVAALRVLKPRRPEPLVDPYGVHPAVRSQSAGLRLELPQRLDRLVDRPAEASAGLDCPGDEEVHPVAGRVSSPSPTAAEFHIALLADLPGQPDENALRASDVTELIPILVLFSSPTNSAPCGRSRASVSSMSSTANMMRR